jgi:GNAT superfamily N-acetyltransferase
MNPVNIPNPSIASNAPPPAREINELIDAIIRLIQGDKLLDKQLAGIFGVDAGSFSTYRQGKRAPRSKASEAMGTRLTDYVIEKLVPSMKPGELARHFAEEGFEYHPDPEKLAAMFQAQFNAAQTQTQPAPITRLLSDQEFVISTIDNGVFSAPADAPHADKRFFNRVLTRFTQHLGVKERFEPRTGTAADRHGSEPLSVGYFASANRTLNMGLRFFKTPFRISLNAVCHEKFADRIQDVAAALFEEKHLVSTVFPILVKGEVGQQYFHDVFLLDEQNPELMAMHPGLNLKDLRKSLFDKSKDTPVDGRVPIVLLNEYDAITLARDGGEALRLVLPLTSARSNQNFKARREMPAFFMTLAHPRNLGDIGQLLDQALELFFSTEVETTSTALANTFAALCADVEEAVKFGEWSKNPGDKDTYSPHALPRHIQRTLAREYALFALSLDHGTAKNPRAYPVYWENILQRTRRIVMEETFRVVNGTSDARSIVDDVLGKNRVKHALDLAYLDRYFDTKLEIDHYRGLTGTEVLQRLEPELTQLESEPEKVNIVPVFSDDADGSTYVGEEKLRAIEELLNQLGRMYQDLPDPLNRTKPDKKGKRARKPDSTDTIGKGIFERLEEEIQKLREGKRAYSQILLAVLEKKLRPGTIMRKPAGIVCVLAPGHGDPKELAKGQVFELGRQDLCELRYLWVAERLRRKNIGQLLLGEALEWCRARQNKQGDTYAAVRLAILPQLEFAIDRVRQIGFQQIESSKLAPDRFIFEYKFK